MALDAIMSPPRGTQGEVWSRSQHGGEAYEDRGRGRNEVATGQGRQGRLAPQKRDKASSPEPAEKHDPVGLPEFRLQPQGCEGVKFLLV